MYRKICLIALVLFFAGFVSADIQIEDVDRTATTDEPAEFLINIENNFDTERRYRISSVRSPEGSFRYNSSIDIGPGETETFHLQARTGEYTVRGNYRFTVNIRAGNEHIGSVQDYFRSDSESDIRIRSLSVENEDVQPGERVEAELQLLNIAPRAVDYSLNASFGNQTTRRGGDMSSGSDMVHSLNFDVNESASPEEKDLEVDIYSGDSIQTSHTRTVNIGEVKDYRIDESSYNRLIESSNTLTVINTGNTRLETEINRSVPRYFEPLVSFSEQPERHQDNGAETIYYWKVEVEPGQQYDVGYTVSYWPPLLVAAFIFGGLMSLKKFKTPVKFGKTVKEMEDGLKIHLEIENHSNNELENLEVKDFVPNVATVKDDFPMAKPVVRKTSNGTKLTWELESMKPGEQRLLEYSIKPVVEVEEGIVLSGARLEDAGEKVSETEEVQTGFKP